jgi:hypothetical protein
MLRTASKKMKPLRGFGFLELHFSDSTGFGVLFVTIQLLQPNMLNPF